MAEPGKSDLVFGFFFHIGREHGFKITAAGCQGSSVAVEDDPRSALQGDVGEQPVQVKRPERLQEAGGVRGVLVEVRVLLLPGRGHRRAPQLPPLCPRSPAADPPGTALTGAPVTVLGRAAARGAAGPQPQLLFWCPGRPPAHPLASGRSVLNRCRRQPALPSPGHGLKAGGGGDRRPGRIRDRSRCLGSVTSSVSLSHTTKRRASAAAVSDLKPLLAGAPCAPRALGGAIRGRAASSKGSPSTEEQKWKGSSHSSPRLLKMAGCKGQSQIMATDSNK